MDATRIYVTALPIFLTAIFLEAIYFQFILRKEYSWKVTAANLTVAFTYLGLQALTKGVFLAAYVAAYQRRVLDIPLGSAWSYFALFLAVDLSYYWSHRMSHEIRWIWALHSVHHSAEQLTLATAYRLGWTNLVSGMWLFLIPVCWLGFEPRAVVAMQAFNLLYQFWLHTELVGKLGWFEKGFNTPSHHRVHHGSNPEYIDRNYSGIFIFWDKLFGTFTEEDAKIQIRYGLIHPVTTLNPVKIAFAEWVEMIRDLRQARSLREVFGYLLGRPGWKPMQSNPTCESEERVSIC